MSSIPFGAVWQSVDLGRTWNVIGAYNQLIVDAQNTALVLMPVAGPGADQIQIASVQDFAIYRNRVFLYRDTDYNYNPSTELATLSWAIALGDTIAVDIALNGGTMTITMNGNVNGSVDGQNQTFTLDHTPLTDVRLVVGRIDMYQNVDFTVSGTTVRFVNYKPKPGTLMRAMFGY